MSSNMEKFIRQNRRDFDTEQPPAGAWDEIEKTLPVKKDGRKFTLREMIKWSAAAALLVAILTSVYFLYIKKSHDKQVADTHSVNPKPTLPDELGSLSPEYAVQLQDATQSITLRQHELKAAASGQPQLYKQFEADLKVLDSTYASLRKQAAQTPNRDVLIKAMIQNLQLQAELLGRQLKVMQEFNKTQIHNNEQPI